MTGFCNDYCHHELFAKIKWLQYIRNEAKLLSVFFLSPFNKAKMSKSCVGPAGREGVAVWCYLAAYSTVPQKAYRLTKARQMLPNAAKNKSP